MADRREDLARLCEHLVRLRRAAPDETTQIVDNVRAGEDVGEQVSNLLERLGIPEPGQIRRVATGAVLRGVTQHTAGEVFVCPAELCVRVLPRRSGVATPKCGIAGVPFRLDRV
jgi:hypothetical protein